MSKINTINVSSLDIVGLDSHLLTLRLKRAASFSLSNFFLFSAVFKTQLGILTNYEVYKLYLVFDVLTSY